MPFRAWILTNAGVTLAWGFKVDRGAKFPLFFGVTLVCMGFTCGCFGAGGTMVGRPVALLDKVGIRLTGAGGVRRSVFLGMNCELTWDALGTCPVFV